MDEEPEKDKKIKNKIKSKRGGICKKSCCKIFTNVDRNTYPPGLFRWTTWGMDKGKLVLFWSHNINEVILQKRHHTVNLCYICDRLSCDSCFILFYFFAGMATHIKKEEKKNKRKKKKKWRRSKSIWARAHAVIALGNSGSFIPHINKINKYKNNCRNLSLPFVSTKTGKVHKPVWFHEIS